MPKAILARERSVFLNVPFDERYEPLYVALITGVCALGFTPRSVVETPPGKDRLHRLIDLIGECRSSIHDLSRVDLAPGSSVPRFNMPFELGVAVAIADRTSKHDWFVLESTKYRLQKSLSDVNGYDPFIHGNKPDGVLKAIRSIFAWDEARPNLADLRSLLGDVKKLTRTISKDHGLDSFFERTGFGQLVVGVQELVAARRKKLWQ